MDLLSIVSYSDGLEQLAKLALNKELIPIFGAGFTAGCQAAEGIVPDSQHAKDSMIKFIMSSSGNPFSSDDLANMSFFDISDLFFEYVSQEDRAQYFEQHYTSVQLFYQQQNFLKKINWPYAYTLNVDDGIERNSDFSPILPYHKFRRPQTSKKLLYKLHGDAVTESQYIDDKQENIVFSQSQYMQAITKEENTDIYKALLSDYAQRHLLFVGCSLQSEQDLRFVYEKSLEFQKETFRVVLRKEIPSISEQQNLKKHGVNEIILIEDYEKFYIDFLAVYIELVSESKIKVYEHLNPTFQFLSDKADVLQLISGGNIFDPLKNEFQKGALHIWRTAVKLIITELKSNNYVLLKGRRFSGKTYVLCSLAEYFKTKDVLYFPSTSFADEEIVQLVFTLQKNSLFLFDSNSITPDVYALLTKYAPILKENNNYMVVAANSNDNNLISKLQCNVIELNNCFVGDEIASCQKALDSYALTRRRKQQTNIDFLYSLKVEQNIKIPFMSANNIEFTAKEHMILIALCALDKLYFSDLIALGISVQETNNLCKKISPFIEIIPTGKDEVTRHSSSKLVHNSKIALTEILKHFTMDKISTSVVCIVKKFRPDYSRRRLYIEIILFDTLNQIFAGYKNPKLLIYNIYIALQPMLESDMHYWLQRAKSIYRSTSNLTELDDAYTFAKKAYLDGNQDLATKAALTTALICCGIAELNNEPTKKGYYEESVVLAYEAVFSEYFRIFPNYLKSELPIGENTQSERRLTQACNYVTQYSTNSDYAQKANEILQRFQELKKVNRSKRK